MNTGEKFGSSFSGSGWTNLSRLSAFDNSRSESGAAGSNSQISALSVTDPDLTAIGNSDSATSVAIKIEAAYLSAPVYLESITLLVGGVAYGSSQGPSSTLSTGSDTTLNYTFSLTGLSGADIKASGFGCRIVFRRTIGKGVGSASVDGVTFDVTYTPSSTRSTWAKRKITRGFKPTGKGL